MPDGLEPGMTTAELDAIGAARLAEFGARSAPMLAYDFPAATCISINEQAGDGWTLVGEPGNLSAQFEHTLIITRGAPIVVTTQ